MREEPEMNQVFLLSIVVILSYTLHEIFLKYKYKIISSVESYFTYDNSKNKMSSSLNSVPLI